MHIGSLRSGISTIASLVLLCAYSPEASAAALRRFEVRDSVEMSYFGNLWSSTPQDLDDDGILSPDGRYFVKVTHRGVLPEGVTEGTIWLFETAAVQMSIEEPKVEPPKPASLVRMAAAVNGGLGLTVLDAGNTITDLRWSDDGRALTFLGRNGRANRQLFRVDVTGRTVTALTPPTQDVLAYSQSDARFVYLVGPDMDRQSADAWVSAGPGIPDISVGTSVPLMPLLYPHFRGNAYSEPLEVRLWQVHDGHVSSVVNSSTGEPIRLVTKYTALLVALAPDGRHAATIAELNAPDTARGKDVDVGNLQYVLIDLVTGAKLPLPQASIATQAPGRYRAAWSHDGAQIAVTNVILADSQSGASSPRVCDIAIIDSVTSARHCVAKAGEQGSLYSVGWLPSSHAILAQYRRADGIGYSEIVLRDRGSTWVQDKRSAERARPPVELGVHEGLDEPPVLVATDARTGRSRVIFDPNPQLTTIALGSVRVYRWKDSHGHEDAGGLAVPADFMPGKRYALVIQTHGFNPRRFFRSGYSDTSNAGRALAGRELLVLQVHEPHPDGQQTWRDGIELGSDVYLAAVDKLAADGLIDPARVGISGYSYSGWLVANAITREPHRFAAAELANTDPVTLTGYYEYVGTPLAAAEADLYVGARPYGEGLKTWTERVPSLSTDKITAPVLFQPADPWHLLGIWDMYAAMLDQHKPVELQYIRGGEHNIRKPLEVLAHQEMIVDWFDFWLNGHEDSDPAKVEQYNRWRKLRERQQQANLH